MVFRSELTYTFSKRKLDPDSSVDRFSAINSSSESLSTENSSLSTLFPSLKPHVDNDLVFPLSKSVGRELQHRISKSSPLGLSQALQNLYPKIPDLMTDIYGNYVCQTIFHTCSADQRLSLLSSLKGHMERISYNPRGTHALQILISLCSSKEEEKSYIEDLRGKIFNMSKDVNASHVVQKLLNTLNLKFFVLGEIRGRARDLALDKFGVCVVKKCLSGEIASEIIEHVLVLIQDPYGNYAVQGIIENWGEEIAFELYSSIKGKISQLCLHKFASNVIEKMVQMESIREGILREIFDEERFKELIVNQYGCYVVRTFCKYCRVSEKKSLLSVAEKSLKNCSFQKLKPIWSDIIRELSN